MTNRVAFLSSLAASGLLALCSTLSFAQAAPEAASAQSDLSGVTGATVQITPGFYWTKVQQTYRAIGDNKTWTYLESFYGSSSTAPVWVWCDDNECEKTFIAAAASGHWLGINFNTTTTFDHVRLYKY
ncbi:hypothetical protein [Thiocapsa marina]|uniref:Uncharacterized protein n=1 Tax=Thiocapsa marina 5811 TaxID=768671 RepID=F9U996_9GAMM|nr:hypothetical protein [Thiocapsa marina]EGV19354.1 hypothetical protein ThimaDRAFT_1498 [Thiocapsa marina 5811]